VTFAHLGSVMKRCCVLLIDADLLWKKAAGNREKTLEDSNSLFMRKNQISTRNAPSLHS